MNQAKINYILQGYKNDKERLEEAQQIAKDNSPDISKMKGVLVNKNTTIYPKTKERYEELLSRGNHK